MTGKLLGAGAIRGDDGTRYYYDEGEIKNLKDEQKLEGCEVDFDIKDGKAIAIYITSESKAESSTNQTNQNHSNEIISKELNIGNTKGFIFKGKVSNCRNELMSHTSGSFKTSNVNTLPGGTISGGGGSGSISTIHIHFTYFDMGNKSFVLQSNNPLSNGDEVVVYVESAPNGYHNVVSLKNLTKGLSFEKVFYLLDGANVVNVIKGIFAVAILGFIGYAMIASSSVMSLVDCLCWIAFIVAGFYISKKIQSKRLKLLFVMLFLCYVIPLAFVYIKTGYMSYNPYTYIYDTIYQIYNYNTYFSKKLLVCMGGIIIDCIALLLILFTISYIASDYRKTKAINKAVREYE